MPKESRHSLKKKFYLIIFETNTKAGKLFDICLIFFICLSVLETMLSTVYDLNQRYHQLFYSLEWIITILFSIEYVIRIYIAPSRTKYIKSFYGIIDILAILPTYFSLFLVNTGLFPIVRILRLFRIFRILKLVRYVKELDRLGVIIYQSRIKIFIFVLCILLIAIVFGTIMYVIEGPDNGFTSIPRSIYWVIVTLSTVGYGDISPKTTLGQFLTTVLIIFGYGFIAIPASILSVELSHSIHKVEQEQLACKNCGEIHNPKDAQYCKSCGVSQK